MDRYKQRLIDRLNRERLEAAQQQPQANLFAEGGPDLNRQPGESISAWRKRVRDYNMYGTYGGELEPAVIIAEDVRSDANQRRDARKFLQRNGEINTILQNDDNNIAKLNTLSDSLMQKPHTVQWVTAKASDLNRMAGIARNILPEDDRDLLDKEKIRNYDSYLSSPGFLLDTYDNISAAPFLNKSILFRNVIGPLMNNHKVSNIASQLYRYYSRHHGYQNNVSQQKDPDLFGTGADIVDLHNNVIRLTPDSQQSNALFNEFVESKYPSVLSAKQYRDNPDMLIGDKMMFPARNINVYAGIEDGKFKIDSLSNFNDGTTVIPARNIKKDMPKISQIIIGNNNEDKVAVNDAAGQLLTRNFSYLNDYEILEDAVKNNKYDKNKLLSVAKEALNAHLNHNKNALNEISLNTYNSMLHDVESGDISDYEALSKLLFDFAYYGSFDKDYYESSNVKKQRAVAEKILSDLGDMRLDEIVEAAPYTGFVDDYYKMNNQGRGRRKSYAFIGDDGNTYPISDYNASVLDGKTLLGNGNGSFFIGRLQDISPAQLDSLNARLSNDPMWLMRTDLGSFNQYDLNSPSLEGYLKQYFEHPKANDPNVYTVGTTTPNLMWNDQKAFGGKLKKK